MKFFSNEPVAEKSKITTKKKIEEIMKKAIVCRLAMCENNIPYIVPVCFGYEDNFLYIHSASKGKKINILKKNPNVCIEIDIEKELFPDEIACKWDIRYSSLIGFGKASFVEDDEEKIKALNIIMKHYSNKHFEFKEEEVKKVTIIKVKIEKMTYKESKP